jgi:hypothetical protein
MGVLDDAIREHLELKRRHGASDEAVAKEEAEALGPARRDFPAQPAAEASIPIADETGTAVEPAAPEPAVEPTEIHEPEPEPFAPEPEPEPEVEPASEPDPVTSDQSPVTEDEREPAEPHEPSDDDVLEDTPEFLQETPEHDRLWFEQKPPRDFDFE